MIRLVNKRPAAERDIEECFVFIAEKDLDKGIEFLVAIDKTLNHLGRFPSSGRVVEISSSTLSEIRVWRVKGYERYLLLYTVAHDEVEVIRFLHSSRDIESIFG